MSAYQRKLERAHALILMADQLAEEAEKLNEKAKKLREIAEEMIGPIPSIADL